MIPAYGFLGAEGGLAYIPVGRGGGESAEINAGQSEGVGRPESGADIVHAAHIIHDNEDIMRRTGDDLFLGPASERFHTFADKHAALMIIGLQNRATQGQCKRNMYYF